MSPDTITPSGESVAPKAPYTTHGIKGLFDIGYKTGGADVYNDVMAPTSYNNAAKGSFSIPKVGSQVWVFFENGSLDYPVYFGYVFDKNDWKTVFNPQDSNPDINYPAASENIEETDRLMDMYDDYLISRTTLTQKQLNKVKNKKIDWYFGSDEALSYNIINEVI